MKKQAKKYQVVMVATLAVFGLGLVLAVAGLSKSVENIDTEMVAREPEAILASAGVTSGMDIDLPVMYYDQKADACADLYGAGAQKAAEARQFEWSSCGYHNKQLEQGLVDYNLGSDGLPVAEGGKLLSNRGVKDMDRWFSAVDGQSMAYPGEIKLAYKVNEGVPTFTFNSNDFYPLGEADFSKSDSVNKDGKNHLFTMNFALPFVVAANGGEGIEVVADDDTFVFVGNNLVIDMGGIHDATKGRLMINESGEIYTAIGDEEFAYSGTTVEKGKDSIVRIFHADRDSDGSVFKIKLVGLNLTVVKTQVAGANGVQVAFNPDDPGYVAPLGESLVFRPDNTRGYVILATILGAVVVVSAVFVSILAHALIKSRRKE